MSKLRISRFIAVAVGAAVLFGLETGFDVKFYLAIPAALLAYIVTLVGAGLILGADPSAK